MVLVDTSVWIDHFNGVDTRQSIQLDKLLGSGRILIGDLILAELLQGFATDGGYRRARELLLDLPYADLVGKDISLAAAANFRKLRSRGVTVRKTIDMIIGTYCLLNNHELLHSDRDFDAMEQSLGLRVFGRS